MTSEQQLAGWFVVFIIVTISFMAGLRLRNWLHKRTWRPDPLAPEYKAEQFSSRRGK
jgi:hypothetical protein